MYHLFITPFRSELLNSRDKHFIGGSWVEKNIRTMASDNGVNKGFWGKVYSIYCNLIVWKVRL